MGDRCIAVDLGAESGRVVVGTLVDGRLTLEVVHRFPTPRVEVDGTLRWDLPALQRGIAEGIARAAAGGPVRSIGIDAWGVDYALLDAGDRLVELPWHHRDARTRGVADAFHERHGAAAFFARSGVASLPFNTVFQLAAHRRDDPATLARARRILPISDALHLWLSGVAAWERTQVGTWQLATPGAAAWDEALLAELGLDRTCLGPIAASGTVLGPVRPALARELGLDPSCLVVLPAGHDTASAVAGMATDDGEAAYLSSGTWSLLGCVLDRPRLGEDVRSAGFANEVAADGRARLNRNIMGLWIVQECRRAFVAAGRAADYAALATAAAAEPASTLPLDVDDARFLPPSRDGDTMPDRVRAWCRQRGVPAPGSDAAVIRCCLDGLADAYRRAFADLERLAGRRFAALNIIGGGSRNALLDQLAADAIGRPVLAGPVEATALGNLLVQARATGLLRDAAEASAVVARSTDVQHYTPGAAVGAA